MLFGSSLCLHIQTCNPLSWCNDKITQYGPRLFLEFLMAGIRNGSIVTERNHLSRCPREACLSIERYFILNQIEDRTHLGVRFTRFPSYKSCEHEGSPHHQTSWRYLLPWSGTFVSSNNSVTREPWRLFRAKWLYNIVIYSKLRETK